MVETPSPNCCCADDELMKHVMKVFEDATKVCEDMDLKKVLETVGRTYDSLNNYAIDMFNSMAKWGLTDEAKELFKPLPGRAVLPDVAIYTVVIQACTLAGKTKAVLKVYQHMIDIGIAPSLLTYTILIIAFVMASSDNKFVGYGKNCILEMLDKGMKPNSVFYTGVFKAIALRESVEKATEFLALIKARGFCEEGQFKQAMKTIKVYTDLFNSTTEKDVGMVFGEWFTNETRVKKESAKKMIKALCKDGNLDEVMELWPTCESSIKHMVILYTSVIETYLKLGKTKSALEVYQGMLASKVSPNSYTYTVLIKGLTADPNFFREAKKCLLEMMDRGKQPNAATHTAVIEGFARKEDKAAEEEGKEFVEVMMGKGFVPNAKAMREVLKGRPIPVIRRVMSIVLSKLKN